MFREVIQEDESGSIAATVNAINQKNRRKELAQLPNVRLGMVRVYDLYKNLTFLSWFYLDASSLFSSGYVRCYERSRSSTKSTCLFDWGLLNSSILFHYFLFSFFLAFKRIYLSLFRFKSHLSNRYNRHTKKTCRKNQWISWQSSFTCRSTWTIKISRMWRWSFHSKCIGYGFTNIKVIDKNFNKNIFSKILDICQSILVGKCFSFLVV